MWSIPTTLVIIEREAGGTCRKALKAVMSERRMSLPGWLYMYSNGPRTTFSFCGDHSGGDNEGRLTGSRLE